MNIKFILKTILKKFLPKKIKKKFILIESDGKYDNGWVFYSYIKNKRFKTIFFESGKKTILNKLKYFYVRWNINRFEYIFCTYFCYSSIHNNVYFFNHGNAFKKVATYINCIDANNPIWIYPTINSVNKISQITKNKKISYYLALAPRLDFLKRKINFKLLDIDKREKKIIGVLTTFRRIGDTDSVNFNDIYPFVNDYIKLNDLAKAINIHIVFKLHHVFDNIKDFNCMKYSNISFIKNKEMVKNGIDTTEFIGSCDALVSDYSSVFIDYLLLNRPILFFVGDMEKFKNNDNDGFLYDNPINYMPGDKFVNQKQFESLLKNLFVKDLWSSKRKELSKFFNGVDNLKNINCCEKIYKEIILQNEKAK